MLDIPVVSWRDIHGNKYAKFLDPAMLLEHDYPVTMKAKVVGKGKSSDLVTIVYDKEYVINWLIVKVIKPLSNYGIQKVTNLLHKAWQESGLSIKFFTK